MSKRNIIFILFILFGISGLFTYFQSLPSLLEKKPTLATGKILARPMEIDRFELIDQKNEVFNNKSLEGGWTVLFFGYTNCPDVCPTTIYKLDEYIGYFDETMLGVTGTYENIQSFTSSLSVFYQRINKEEGYDFNHTASIFVFDKNGLLFATMSPANTIGELTEDFYTILNNFQ